MALSTLFLLLADPLKFTTLAIIWAVTGLICGLIIRKRIGSVTTALSVFFGQFVIIGLAGFRVFEILRATGVINISRMP
jgi:predicted membrane channel-forming protein YqfA (hemolysin III family)